MLSAGGRPADRAVDLPDSANMVRKMGDARDDTGQLDLGAMTRSPERLEPCPRFAGQRLAQRCPLVVADRTFLPAGGPVGGSPRVRVSATPPVHQRQPVADVVHVRRD